MMRVFERSAETWMVQSIGLSSGSNPMNHAVEFRRSGDRSGKFVPGQIVFIDGGNIETVSEQDLCTSLAEGLRKHGAIDGYQDLRSAPTFILR